MQISAEAMAGIVGGLVLGIFGAYRVVITMREQIKTLFNQVKEIKKETDQDIEKIKKEKDADIRRVEAKLEKQDEKFEKVFAKFDDVISSQIEGMANLSEMMNALHIKMIEKLSEKQQ